MARMATRRVGSKFGGLLSGLLGGLYAGSSPEVNPDYANPGGHAFDDPNFDANNVQPFQSGGGLFGGVRAKEANTNFTANNLLAQLASDRAYNNQVKLMPLQLEQEKNILKARSDIEQNTANTLLGEQGAATGNVLANLPTDQLASIIPPTQTFSSPQAQQRYIVSAFGQKPVNELPTIAANQANELKIAQDPRTLSAKQSEVMAKGLANIGGNTHVNLDTNTAYQGANRETLNRQVDTGKRQWVLNQETGQMEQIPIMANVQESHFTPPNISNLADYRMTPEIVKQTAVGTASMPSGEFSEELGIVPNYLKTPSGTSTGADNAETNLNVKVTPKSQVPAPFVFPRVMPGRSSGGVLKGYGGEALNLELTPEEKRIKELENYLRDIRKGKF